MSEGEVLEVFDHAWVNEGFISREHEEMRWNAGQTALKRFIKSELATPSNPKYIEKSFSFTLKANKISGRLDRVDILTNDQAVIIDFKSSEVSEQKDADKRARESLQLKLYAAAWQHTEGGLPARLELHFLETGLVGTVVVDQEEIETTERKILQVADKIREQDFKATPGAWTCGYCPFRTICPSAQA
jgi:DNA helicase-2/ATP-dependent DNA helicase PcrA